MAISTALDYVQRALSIIDADEVTTISETVEAGQVFDLLKNVYDELLDYYPWPHLNEFMVLVATNDDHIMSLPTDCVGFNNIRYNKKNVTYIEPMEMQALLDSRDTTLSSVDANGAITDRDPAFWSTIDDDNIIFDSYNVVLSGSLSLIDGVKKPSALLLGTDRPDIPERMESCLRNMLFAEALRILKGDESRALVYDRKVMSQMAKLKRWAKRHNKNVSWYGPSYGRQAITNANIIERINEA
jgi:hypothetical protein